MSGSLKYQGLSCKAQSQHGYSVPPTVQLLLSNKAQKLNITETDYSQALTLYL